MQAPDMPASDINQAPETDDPLAEEIEAQSDEPEDLDDDFDLGEDDDFLSFDIDLDDEDPKS